MTSDCITHQVAFSLSAMVVIIRFLDTLTVFASLSLLIEMLLEMMRSSLMIVVVFMITSIGFGTAFAGLMPQGQNDENVFARPFWISFRTMVGDFDILETYELNGDSYSRGRNIMGYVLVILIWLYAFIATIYIVNLLIAQMTTNYEKILVKNNVYVKFRRVQLVLEYKDMRGLPPPLNLFWLPLLFCYRLLTCRLHLFFKPGDARGFCEFVWTPRSDHALKVEREARDKYFDHVGPRPSASQNSMATSVGEIRRTLNASSERSERTAEFQTHQFERLEKMVLETQQRLDRMTFGTTTGTGGKGDAGIGGDGRVKGGGGGGGGEVTSALEQMRLRRLAPLNCQAPYVPPSAPARHAPAFYKRSSSSSSTHSTFTSTDVFKRSLGTLPVDGGYPSHPSPPRTSGAGRSADELDDLVAQIEARQVFLQYDPNGSGDIDFGSLRSALNDLGLAATSAQTAAIVAKYDNGAHNGASSERLDFSAFTRLIAELRQLQRAGGGSLVGSVPLQPGAGADGGGCNSGMRTASGGGYYSPEELAALQEDAARRATLAERIRLGEVPSLRSLDAGE